MGGGAGFGLGFGGGSGGGIGFGEGAIFLGDINGDSPAIAAGGKYVYVVHNNKLHQFNAEGLTEINAVSLERSADVDD